MGAHSRMMCYRDNHRYDDRKIMDPIVAEGDDAAARTVSDAVCKDIGLSADEIAALRTPPAADEVRGKGFDPNEPRDEHGRWTEGGGSSGAGEDGGGSKLPPAVRDTIAELKSRHEPMSFDPGANDAGLLFPDGEHVSIGGLSSQEAAEKAGGDVATLHDHGTARVTITEAGQQLQLYAPKPLTTEQYNTLTDAVEAHDFHRFGIDNGSGKDDGRAGIASAEPIKPQEMWEAIQAVHPLMASSNEPPATPAPSETGNLPSGGNAPGVPNIEPGALRRANDIWWGSDADPNWFPNMDQSNAHVIGSYDRGYNCAAFAMGDTERWWWPSGGYGTGCFWPDDVTNNPESMDSFDDLFTDKIHGCALPDNPAQWNKVEPGFTRVAVYADSDGTPQHLARQTTSGTWISKMGGQPLIEHDELDDVAGGGYGEVARVYRLPDKEWQKLARM
jgi:hypothetical protein